MFPKLLDLRDLEQETLDLIITAGEFASIHEIRDAASSAIKGISQRGNIDFHLGFTLDIRLRSDRRAKEKRRRIDVGALVQQENGKIRNASYSLIICRNPTVLNSPIVRKVHFDYEPVAYRNHSEPKPSSHLQICGKFSSHHRLVGYDDSRLGALYPDWEKPRIPFPPVSLAILLNWLLTEFQSDASAQAILKSPVWRKHVSKAERLMLLPYYTGAVDFFGRAVNKEKRLLQGFYYELDAG